MNYIKHLSGFFNCVSKDDRLNSTHVSMYVSLFQFWNASRFENPISISRSEVMNISKISSKSTYHKCIRDLHDFGYLQYIPSYNPLKGSLVYLHNFEDAPGQFSSGNHTNIQSGSGQTLAHNRTESETGSGQALVRSHTESGTGSGQALVSYINTLNINKHINSLNLEDSQTVSSKKEKFENEEEVSCAAAANPSQSPKSLRLSGRSRPVGKMIPPTPEMLRQYFSANGYSDREADKFFNYFSSNGWLVGGKSPMKDWQAAARNWMLNVKTNFNANRNNTSAYHLLNSPAKNYGEPL